MTIETNLAQYSIVFQAVRSTQTLEVPLVHNGELMVSDKVSIVFSLSWLVSYIGMQCV